MATCTGAQSQVNLSSNAAVGGWTEVAETLVLQVQRVVPWASHITVNAIGTLVDARVKEPLSRWAGRNHARSTGGITPCEIRRNSSLILRTRHKGAIDTRGTLIAGRVLVRTTCLDTRDAVTHVEWIIGAVGSTWGIRAVTNDTRFAGIICGFTAQATSRLDTGLATKTGVGNISGVGCTVILGTGDTCVAESRAVCLVGTVSTQLVGTERTVAASSHQSIRVVARACVVTFRTVTDIGWIRLETFLTSVGTGKASEASVISNVGFLSDRTGARSTIGNTEIGWVDVLEAGVASLASTEGACTAIE